MLNRTLGSIDLLDLESVNYPIQVDQHHHLAEVLHQANVLEFLVLPRISSQPKASKIRIDIPSPPTLEAQLRSTCNVTVHVAMSLAMSLATHA